MEMYKMKDLTCECIEYFKSNSGFKRAIKGIKEKYYSLGYLGGNFVLNNVTDVEKEALSGFLGKELRGKSVAINVKKFINALKNTKFEDINFIDVIEGYFNEELVYKKEEKEKLNMERNECFDRILMNFEKGSPAFLWINDIKNKKNAGDILASKIFEKSRDDFFNIIKMVGEGVNSLSFNKNKYERLAVFSARITKNPHFFDETNEGGKFLLYAISFILGESIGNNAEQKAELLYKAGIVKDEISNFTTVCGILGYSDDIENLGIRYFYEKGEPFNLNLWNMNGLEKVTAPNGAVYVFENPSVFSSVLEKTSKIKPSMVCTYGQVKLASLILLDRLYEDGCTIFYSGDLDPEGILIADKLKKRYKEKLILWHYEILDYKQIISNEKISELRLKKLGGVESEEFYNLINIMKECKCSAYQEMLLDKYIDDIINGYKI